MRSVFCLARGIMSITAIAALSVAWGTPSTYDDMGSLRPSGGSDEFWNTSAHAAVAIDVADSAQSVGLDSRLPQPVAAATTLSSFDSRWRTQESSPGSNLKTGTPGVMIYFK